MTAAKERERWRGPARLSVGVGTSNSAGRNNKNNKEATLRSLYGSSNSSSSSVSGRKLLFATDVVPRTLACFGI